MHEYEYTGKAMGTDFSLAVVCDDPHVANAVNHRTEEKIRAYEAQFSRFLETSELSLLNTERHMEVSPVFLEVTLEAKRLYDVTQGVFNPLVQIARLGYIQSYEDLHHTSTSVDDATYNIDFSQTLIDTTAHTITLMEGQKLDFGGFLKGYLAEKLCHEIMDFSVLIQGAIVNIGGDIHARGYDAADETFIFTIFNPVTGVDDIQISLTNKSLATSGTYKRTWVHNAQATHHILDASGIQNPITSVVSASVIHPHGGTAEAYAKVFLGKEPEDAQALCDSETEYIIIKNDGQIISNCI